ncbi:hypothetical protein [Pantoea vagans]|uniref:hypothetical protein n=1 Tax=Pantoea vagans TaxID=470934 RepID=UPI0032079909
MKIDEERIVMITNAIGLAVLELRFREELITQCTLSEKLEEMMSSEVNVIGKGVCGDAAELVRGGKLPVA